MNSLSSTRSFIGRSEQRVVSLRVVRTEAALTGCGEFLQQLWRLRIKLLLFHPTEQGLASDFIGVGIALGYLSLDELLNRLRHLNFHALKLPQSARPDNDQMLSPLPGVGKAIP